MTNKATTKRTELYTKREIEHARLLKFLRNSYPLVLKEFRGTQE